MENNYQSASTPNPSTNQLVSKERILKPTAASVEAIQAAQLETSQNAPSPNNPAEQGVILESINQPRTSVSTTSIYPEATKGVGIPTQNPVQDLALVSTESFPVDIQIKGKILSVQIVAGFMILINVVNAVDWFIAHNEGYTNWIGIIEILIMLALAVYIFKLSEAARATYVLIASILIAITVINLVLFEVHNHNNPVFKDSYSSLTKAQLQQGIIADEHDPRLSAAQKQALIKPLQNQLNLDSESTVDIRAKEYLSDALLFLITIGPIIFFTRPSIKAVFK